MICCFCVECFCSLFKDDNNLCHFDTNLGNPSPVIAFIRLAYKHGCGTFSWLPVDMWGHIPLQGVLSLGRGSWLGQRSRLSKPWGASQQASFLCGLCVSPCPHPQVPLLLSMLFLAMAFLSTQTRTGREQKGWFSELVLCITTQALKTIQ